MSKKKRKFRLEGWKILTILFISYLSITFVKQEIQIRELKNKRVKAQKQVDLLEREVDSLKEEIQNSDSLIFIEKIAREELGMVKPREIIVVDKNKKKNPFLKGLKDDN